MSEVTSEVRGHVLVITIDRPEARNAVNAAVARGMAEALDRLESDDDLRVAVLTGAGGTFCSGMDLKAFMAGESPVVEGRGLAAITQWAPAKPVVAAVEGWALAGGFEIVLACDLVVAGRTARFGVPEVKRGLVAAAGAAVRLPERVPQPLALELLLTGEPIDADRAHQLGLVNRVVDEGAALEEAVALAERIAANGPLAVAASRRVALESRGWPREEVWTRQDEVVGPVFVSEDAMEGAAAFAEKRDPVWRGR